MFDTSFLFQPGKVLITLDQAAGSSGKGVLNAWICENADNWQFACNAFMSNAAHWIECDDGRRIMYQSLNSCAYQGNYEKLYICGGAILELEPLLREIEENDLSPKTLGIHPLCGIVQKIDQDYERGLCDLDGYYFPSQQVSDNMKLGSTLHGVGAARARRILRKSNVLLARDLEQLKPFICDTREEIINRLDQGQAGILEIAQGFQLGYLEPLFYPKTTSRNCTVAAGLDDCGIPPYYAGDVVLNARTYPIRVNSNKYVHRWTDEVLTWEDLANLPHEDIKKIEGDSGPGYPDQREITWAEVGEMAGCPELREMSSLTKLPRRVFEFSKQNLREAIKYNRTAGQTYLSINFANYVDPNIEGVRKSKVEYIGEVSSKLADWDNQYQVDQICDQYGVRILCWGTGPKTNDKIMMEI